MKTNNKQLENPVFLHNITLKNLLSFGPDTEPLELKSLNVLIGPNGSGKSNLIEAISLLRAAPTHLAAPVRDGGGVRDWLWKGNSRVHATLQVVVENHLKRGVPIRHEIVFSESAQKFILIDERIENANPLRGETQPFFFYKYDNGYPWLSVNREKRQLQHEEVEPDKSILSQRKDPEQYPEITHLGKQYGRIRIYREWSFGRYTVPRQPQKADQPNDQLSETFENFGVVLNRLRGDYKTKTKILENLQQLYMGIEDYDVSIEGGTVQVFFHENGFKIPATRLSDGTLRYLCLLAILCNPDPPPVVCIEEPELGLHPDILPSLARLLKDAANRTQLFVTTHSDILVDELTENPESVVVCEKIEGRTITKRLQSKDLEKWLQKYRLGQLWMQGEIGGTRW
jgi:predicted ATPase